MNCKEDMEKKKLYKAFLKKYKNVSPLIVFKTLEFSKSLGAAFDALEDFNNEYPVVWDEEKERWVSEVLLEYDFLNDGK